MAPGYLIALEGIDGAGTSTQMVGLASYIQQLGFQVTSTAEPSPGPIGVLLRQALVGTIALGEATLALLFAADRLDHLERLVLPALQENHVVLTDRYLLSSLAYQGSQLPLEWLQSLNVRCRPPDLTLFFRVSVATATARRSRRGGIVEHFDHAQRQEQIAAAYDRALSLPHIGQVDVIDAEGSIEQVKKQAHASIASYLRRKTPQQGSESLAQKC